MHKRKESLLYRAHLLIIIGALVLIGLAGWYGSGLFASLTSGGFDVPGSDSLRAQQFLDTYLHGATPDIIVLMQADRLRPADPAFQATALTLLNRLQARREVKTISSYYSTHDAHFLSRDGRETFALIQLAPSDESQKEQAYQTIEPMLVAPPLRLTVGGNVPFNVELNQQISKDLEFAEVMSFPLLALLLLIVFGSAIAALLPLLIGSVTILGAFA